MSSLRFRFGRFVKRHDRWLTLVGAFIVFVTFVMKDGLGEKWRGTAETIDMAEYIYGIRQDTAELRGHLDEIGEQLGQIGGEQSKSRTVPYHVQRDFQQIDNFLGTVNQTLKRERIGLGIIDILANALDDSNPNKQMANQLHREIKSIDSWRAGIGRKMLDANPIISHTHPSDEYLATFSRNLFPEVERLEYAYNQTSTHLSDLDETIFADAEKMRERNKVLSKWASGISAFLFAIGWGLGLVGKLYGVPEAATE
jgi:hypothetical protein